MARRRASMREGPLAELFRATEAAQKQGGKAEPEPEVAPPPEAIEPQEETVEHVPEFALEQEEPAVAAVPDPEPEPERVPEPVRLEPVPEPPRSCNRCRSRRRGSTACLAARPPRTWP